MPVSGKIYKRMIAVTIICVAAIIYFLYNPLEHHFFLFCPLHRFTGYQCPLCGLQQMIHHLLHGQLSGAFHGNPFLFLLIPYFAVLLFFNLSDKKESHPKLFERLYGDRTLLILLIIAVVFGISRNLIHY